MFFYVSLINRDEWKTASVLLLQKQPSFSPADLRGCASSPGRAPPFPPVPLNGESPATSAHPGDPHELHPNRTPCGPPRLKLRLAWFHLLQVFPARFNHRLGFQREPCCKPAPAVPPLISVFAQRRTLPCTLESGFCGADVAQQLPVNPGSEPASPRRRRAKKHACYPAGCVQGEAEKTASPFAVRFGRSLRSDTRQARVA